uniref:Anaphase-promoting complex subunit 4 WD40 domain-containing protein n=1 Tax=Odontella aurita TaxID=265563 RepID=A0A7S4IQ94_9STRA|mmetsp:Transcript_28651/g.84419  ORF Transcript_28651/g.84419 Transcript_28651/m.84419 type:complete len:521 (+) Transcript_28651:596-2158(+)
MPIPRHPSRLETVTFPVFACCWYGKPSLPPTNAGGISILAYCGGGGSAKTGVFNTLAVVVKEQVSPVDPNARSDDDVVAERKIKIDTGVQIGVGVAMHRHHSNTGDVRMLVCVGDKVNLYAVPLEGSPLLENLPEEDEDAGPSLLLGGVTVGEKYGCNAVAFSPLGDAMAVGCENGQVIIYRILHDEAGRATFRKIVEAQGEGHDGAVSSVAFHPRVLAVLSGSKDGTARLWDGRSGSELGQMKCIAEDPDPKKAAAAKKKPQRGRVQRGPPKILVRGCAFGDLEGKVVYTVQSGKRTPAYVSRWVLAPPKAGEPRPQPPLGPDGRPIGPPPPNGNFVEGARAECSEKPVSSLSLSGDASTLVLGNVEGSVFLFDLENMKVSKAFLEVHDLPVTCVAARPEMGPLPGDVAEGVAFDALSASADNRMGFLTKQRRSRKKKARRPGGKAGAGMSTTTLMILMWFFMVLYLVGKMSWRLCRPELLAIGQLEEPAMAFEAAARCVWELTIWAPPTRAGVSVPPH